MIDREATLAALGREIDWHLPTGDDLIAAAGERVDHDALHRALRELVRYVAYTDDDPPRPEAGIEVLRDALDRERAFPDPAATAAAVSIAKRIMGAADPYPGPPPL